MSEGKKVFVERDEDELVIYPFKPVKSRIQEFRKKETSTIPKNELFYEAQGERYKYSGDNSNCILMPFLEGVRGYIDTIKASEIGYRDLSIDWDFCLNHHYWPNEHHRFMVSEDSYDEYRSTLRFYLDGGMNAKSQPFRVTFPQCFGGKTKNFKLLDTYVGPTWKTAPYAIMGGILQITDLEYLEQLLICNKIKLISVATANAKDDNKLNQIFDLYTFKKPIRIKFSELEKAANLVDYCNDVIKNNGEKSLKSTIDNYLEYAKNDEPIIEQVKKYTLTKFR